MNQSKDKDNILNWIILNMKNIIYFFNENRFRGLKKNFENYDLSLNDFDDETKKLMCEKLFYFKFRKCCSNAKYVRCGKKLGYENTEFLLGDLKSIIKNLNKYRPDLVETGTNICMKYIENKFDKTFAPTIHRSSDSGDYEWENIELLTRKEHDQLTKIERQRKIQKLNYLCK